MEKSITSLRRIRHQRGFSVLEILIATVLISLLVASGLYYANVGDKAAAVDIAATKAAVVVRFPEAVMTVYARKGKLTDTSAADLTATGSARTDAPVTWAVSSGSDAPTADTLSIDLTFSSESEAKAMQEYLADNLDTTLVSAAEVDDTDGKILKVTYSVK